MEGYRYAFGFLPIRYVLIVLSLVSLMGSSYQVLMPIFAKTMLHGGPSTLGFLMAAAGIGALISAGNLATRRKATGIERFIMLGSALFGIGLMGFSHSRNLVISLCAMVIVGFGMFDTLTSCNTTLQIISDEDKRGRVMSFYAMGWQGMVPFGNLVAGTLASHIGAPNTLMLGGISLVAVSFLFGRKAGDQESDPSLRLIGLL